MKLEEKIQKYLGEATNQELSSKEIMVLGLILGFKPNFRMKEYEKHENMIKNKYKIKGEDEFEKIKKQLVNKGVLNQSGNKTKKSREVWENVMDNERPSQLHRWAFEA